MQAAIEIAGEKRARANKLSNELSDKTHLNAQVNKIVLIVRENSQTKCGIEICFHDMQTSSNTSVPTAKMSSSF